METKTIQLIHVATTQAREQKTKKKTAEVWKKNTEIK